MLRRNIVFFANPILARPSMPLILKLFIADVADFLATRSDVRFGSEADVGVGPRHVRFTSKSGHPTGC
jgi:hypothetical protein